MDTRDKCFIQNMCHPVTMCRKLKLYSIVKPSFIGITKTSYFNWNDIVNSTLATFTFILSWILLSGMVNPAKYAHRITVRVRHIPPS